MSSTLEVPLQIMVTAEIHEIVGGGFWAEVRCFPGCVAQAMTREVLETNILRAIEDWLAISPEKTESEARELATIQGGQVARDESFPQHYE